MTKTPDELNHEPADEPAASQATGNKTQPDNVDQPERRKGADNSDKDINSSAPPAAIENQHPVVIVF